ncbi:stage IV sporulation protein FA [Halalkalibacter wakoensis JCM 9140]|uniref:Stage IV sporulation protein FA n=1 Tax=Halalkalibacter wakoensis JCM 9140 TaxID=1236970 RepID=W4Q6Q5_9BACI|nr:M23 family metallopeptidase [Halalkalibacter wakoensis]GAE27682.1 stage IV sporulation protein FA [Halalkalibacter wakoensis JCM 9140]
MSKNLNKVRKKLENRRRQINQHTKHRERTVPMLMHRQEDARDEPDFYMPPSSLPKEPKLHGKKGDYFLFRLMAAVCIFLMTAILFQSTVPQAEGAKRLVQQTYEQEIEFAAIANWYENQFGRPLALLPNNQNMAQGDPNEQVEMVYAVPASGIISQDFDQDGRGILIETGMNAEIEAVKGGQVSRVGADEEGGNLGKTVTVKHYDGTEAVYGMLDKVEVNVYDHIEAGYKVGTVSTNEEAQKGIFYFALKDGEKYINPSEVISFE